MMDLMEFNDGKVPLYTSTVLRVLREMRVQQQKDGGEFDYKDFKVRLGQADLMADQRRPLRQRLDTLESFLALRGSKGFAGNSWEPEVSKISYLHLRFSLFKRV